MLCGQVGVPLTLQGRRQAQGFGKALSQLSYVDALYSGTLRRATETANPIARQLGLEVRKWPSLRKFSCGVLDGLPLPDVKRSDPELWNANLAQNDDEFCWPGGESYRGFRDRVLRAVQRIARAHRSTCGGGNSRGCYQPDARQSGRRTPRAVAVVSARAGQRHSRLLARSGRHSPAFRSTVPSARRRRTRLTRRVEFLKRSSMQVLLSSKSTQQLDVLPAMRLISSLPSYKY